MKKKIHDPFISKYRALDLHGETRDSIKILIDDFINDSIILKEEDVIIIHGIGSGIIKKKTYEILQSNKYVDSFKLNNSNLGMTIVKIHINRY